MARTKWPKDIDERKIRSRERVRQQAIRNALEAIGTGSWLNDNDSFNHSRTLDDPEAVKRAHELLRILLHGKAGYKMGQKEIDMEVLCANLLANKSRVLVTQKPIAISLNRNDWTKSRYTRAGYFTIELVDMMEKRGFLMHKEGIYDKNNPKKSRRSRIWPTQKFNDFFAPYFSVDFKPIELVNLRNQQGKHQDYDETEETCRIREILRRANAVNREAEVSLKTPRGFLTLNTDLYAVFNRDFQHGGRLYTGNSGYQRCTKEERAAIWINHEPIVELDFSGMQPRLLYALEGIQYNGDPYTAVIDDPGLRPFVKSLLLALLNADSLNKAIASGNYELYHDYELYQTLQAIGTKTSELVERFKEAHPKIKHHFCQEMGLRLMNMDSKIALKVIEEFTSQKIPILAIHDSFIVQQKHEELLRKTMQDAYGKVTGGFTCPIK